MHAVDLMSWLWESDETLEVGFHEYVQRSNTN